MGKGPPYTRSSEEPLVGGIIQASRRIDRALSGKTTKERRLLIEKPDRVHYALGILSIEEDFENLDLDEDDNK